MRDDEYNIQDAEDITINIGNENVEIESIEWSVSDEDIDHAELRKTIYEGETEISVDFEIELECEDQTRCPDCYQISAIPSPEFLFTFEIDAQCEHCGFPLGIVR